MRAKSKHFKLLLIFPLIAGMLVSCFEPTVPKHDSVSLDFSRFLQETWQLQMQSNWCWVACVSMVFSYSHNPVSQARLVTEVYGAPYNLPSGNGLNLTVLLNRSWTDDNGVAFQSRVTGVYDQMAGVNAMNNRIIINELANNNPIIIGVLTGPGTSHAVVMIGADYSEDGYGNINITSVTVADPWPGNGIYKMSGLQIVPYYNGGYLIYVCTSEITNFR